MSFELFHPVLDSFPFTLYQWYYDLQTSKKKAYSLECSMEKLCNFKWLYTYIKEESKVPHCDNHKNAMCCVNTKKPYFYNCYSKHKVATATIR